MAKKQLTMKRETLKEIVQGVAFVYSLATLVYISIYLFHN